VRLPSRTFLPTRTLVALVVAGGCLAGLPAIAASQEQPSTSTSSTTTSTPSTTTAADTDEDDGSNLGWLLWAALALAVVLALVWLVSALMSRRTAAKQWDQRRDTLLDEARHAHDGTVDLLARWSNLEVGQLQARWSEEMAHLERLRSHSSSLLAHAPAGSDTRPVEDVAMAVDDVHVALGNASVDPRTPPPYVADAVAALEQTVNAAQHPAAHSR
jgi:hypothetical protein